MQRMGQAATVFRRAACHQRLRDGLSAEQARAHRRAGGAFENMLPHRFDRENFR